MPSSSSAVNDKINAAMALYLDDSEPLPPPPPSSTTTTTKRRNSKTKPTSSEGGSMPIQTSFAPPTHPSPSPPPNKPEQPEDHNNSPENMRTKTQPPSQLPTPSKKKGGKIMSGPPTPTLTPSSKTSKPTDLFFSSSTSSSSPSPRVILNPTQTSSEITNSYIPPTYTRKSSSNLRARDPTPATSSTSHSSPDRSSIAGGRLYARAKQQQLSLKTKQASIPTGCTFTPSFQTTDKSRGTNNERSKGEYKGILTESVSGQDRFDCLYRNAQAIVEKRTKIALNESNNPNGCTFQPSLVATSKSHRSASRGPTGKLYESLYEDAKKMKSKMETAKIANDTKQPLFSPQITRLGQKVGQDRSSLGGSNSDFSSRLYRDENVLSARVKQLKSRKDQGEMEGCTFKPSFKPTMRHHSAPKSRPSWAVDNSSSKDDVSVRLYNSSKQTELKRAVLVEKQEERIGLETPFKPSSMTKNYNKIHGFEAATLVNTADYERLTQTGGVKDKSAKRDELLKAEAKIYTFTPTIPKKRSISAPKSRPGWMSPETPTNDENSVSGASVSTASDAALVFERLYSARNAREEDRVVAKEEQFLREMRYCTFSPAIPVKREEKSGSPKAPVWERLHDDTSSIGLLRDAVKAQSELNDCTFQPALNFNRVLKAAGSVEAEPIHLRIVRLNKEKDALLSYEKARLELKDCTFKPDTSMSQPDFCLQIAGKSKSRNGSVYDRLHDSAKDHKIGLDNKKREFDEVLMRDYTFTPQIGVQLDDDDASFSFDREARIARLAEPRVVSDERYNLEQQKVKELNKRPTPMATKLRGSHFYESAEDRLTKSGAGNLPSPHHFLGRDVPSYPAREEREVVVVREVVRNVKDIGSSITNHSPRRRVEFTPPRAISIPGGKGSSTTSTPLQDSAIKPLNMNAAAAAEDTFMASPIPKSTSTPRSALKSPSKSPGGARNSASTSFQMSSAEAALKTILTPEKDDASDLSVITGGSGDGSGGGSGESDDNDNNHGEEGDDDINTAEEDLGEFEKWSKEMERKLMEKKLSPRKARETM